MKECYKLRTCYVNFAEHLQNSWNVNFMYHDAPGTWGENDWQSFIKEIKAFGFNNFQFWIPPTLCKAGPHRKKAVENFRMIIDICHNEKISANVLIAANTIGAEWYFACPNDAEDRKKILEFWTFYAENLNNADIFTIFPGDPGGCNRNDCDHNTFLELALEISGILKIKNPNVVVEVGTWGTPFTGWGEDMRKTPNWDGSWEMLIDPAVNNPGIPCHIWNGPPKRVAVAMTDMLNILPKFPKDTMISINSGFNPDCEPDGAYDARPWAEKISKTHRITSWDYSASEGELICYPHYRVQKYSRKRKMEIESAPYYGGICYTMSPKLNLLMLYTAAQIMINPDRNPKDIAGEFTRLVFNDEKIGYLMEAFEIVPGWGYEPLNHPKEELITMFSELIERLKNAKGVKSELPIYPGVEEYRKTLLWHAENFLYMLGDNPDREMMKKKYWDMALSIYDDIPLAVDERSQLSAEGYSNIGKNERG